MRSQAAASWPSPTVKNGVLVLSGYGVRVAVRRRHLVVEDGIGRDRRLGRFSRATARLRRLVILGRTGTISLESTRWLRAVGAGVIQIDRDAQVLAAFGPTGVDEPRLRRGQALALSSPSGVEIARTIMREKLRGQEAVLMRIPDARAALDTVRSALDTLEHAWSLSAILMVESSAAAAYWEAWANIPVTFVRSDLIKVPDHWHTFGQRGSPITGSPRLAGNPTNAILNYLYAVAEAETRIACLSVGLDEGLGILHADQRSRASMALDIMEGVRPQVDAFVLDLLRKRAFRIADFVETAQGVCRVLPPLTHALAETAPLWAKRVAPVAERVVHMLMKAPGTRISRIPTPLTQSNRSAGRDAIRRRPKGADLSSRYLPPAACGICGVVLDASDRAYCDDCLREHHGEFLAEFQRAGPVELRRLRAEGRDPAHGGHAGRKRGASNARRKRDAIAWDRVHPDRPDPEVFRREILPSLLRVSLGRIAKATGLTPMYCSRIRRGLYVPHPRHWDVMAKLGR